MKKVSVRFAILDLLAFSRLVGNRQKRLASGSPAPTPVHPVNVLASEVHPSLLNLVVSEVRDESKAARTFRLAPDTAAGTNGLPYFRAGQYLSLKVDVDGTPITRPYSIASAPFEALGAGGFYEITLKRTEDGFLTPWAWEHWKEGTRLASSGPLGTFYHEPIRDATSIIGLAGYGLVALLVQPPREVSVVLSVFRDLSIIGLALVTIIIGTFLGILILQLQSLIALLRDEIKPILESANETASTVRGTTSFVSDAVVTPMITAASYASAVRQTIKTLAGSPARRDKPQPSPDQE